MLKTQQGSRVTIVIVQVGAMKIYVAAVHTLGKMEKTGWNPVISFCKIFIPNDALDGLLCWNWLFSPPLIAWLYI